MTNNCRFRDDKVRDEELRSEIRDGDPMADLMRLKAEKKARKAAKKLKKAQKEGKDVSAADVVAASAVLKPQYKGSFPPNRFGIRPGHRWDGVDRGNGWENKVLAAAKSGPYRS